MCILFFKVLRLQRKTSHLLFTCTLHTIWMQYVTYSSCCITSLFTTLTYTLNCCITCIAHCSVIGLYSLGVILKVRVHSDHDTMHTKNFIIMSNNGGWSEKKPLATATATLLQRWQQQQKVPVLHTHTHTHKRERPGGLGWVGWWAGGCSGRYRQAPGSRREIPLRLSPRPPTVTVTGTHHPPRAAALPRGVTTGSQPGWPGTGGSHHLES